MFIVTIDEETRAVLSHYIPRSPLVMDTHHSGDTTKVYIGREQFVSTDAYVFFRDNYRKFRVTANGRVERFVS